MSVTAAGAAERTASSGPLVTAPSVPGFGFVVCVAVSSPQGIGVALAMGVAVVLYTTFDNNVLLPVFVGKAIDVSAPVTMLGAIGGFAVAGVVLVLLPKAATIASLQAPLPALFLAPLWARWLNLWAAHQPPARKGGLGSAFAAGLTPRVLMVTALLPLLLTLAAAWFDWRSLLGVALAALATFGVVRLAQARIGGVTGAVFGAVVELSETALLVAFAVHPLY